MDTDIATIGVLVAVVGVVVGSTWRLSGRLGAIERTLAEIRADARSVDHRIAQLEDRAHVGAEIRERLSVIEARCVAHHRRQEG